MVGLNYDGDARVIIGTGRYILFMNDELSQYRASLQHESGLTLG